MSLKKILSLSLGLVILATVAGLISTGAVGAQSQRLNLAAAPPPRSVPVSVVNTPTVNANIIGTPTVNVATLPPITGAVTATLSNTAVTVNNAATAPVLVRDVDNGQNPYEVDLTLTNDTASWGTTNSTCNASTNATQCQISFTVPSGHRYVVEHVSAYVDGVTGQTYQTFLSLDVTEFLVMTKQISGSGLDTFTASQPMRVYVNTNRVPPPTVAVTNSVGGSFFARVTLSGYLVPTS